MARPTAQPVNYVLHAGEIIFRTANGSKLVAATRNAVVAPIFAATEQIASHCDPY